MNSVHVRRSYLHCGVLQPAMEFCYSLLMSASSREGPAQDMLHHNCMAFLHGVVACSSYKGSASSAGVGGARDESMVGHAAVARGVHELMHPGTFTAR